MVLIVTTSNRGVSSPCIPVIPRFAKKAMGTTGENISSSKVRKMIAATGGKRGSSNVG